MALSSSAGRTDDPPAGWTSGDCKIVRYMEIGERWRWLFRHCDAEDIRLLLNDAKAKACRQRTQRISTRKGTIEVSTEADVTPMTMDELAILEGLTRRQYERRLTRARHRITLALVERDEERRAA